MLGRIWLASRPRIVAAKGIALGRQARAARESIDRAYEDIFRIFSKDK